MIVECEPGTTGENCSIPCAPGYFGRQCNRQCQCPQGKFCDPTKGCLCNSTSVKCTDPGKVFQHKQWTIIVLSCLVIDFFFFLGFIYFLYESLVETSLNIHSECFIKYSTYSNFCIDRTDSDWNSDQGNSSSVQLLWAILV